VASHNADFHNTRVAARKGIMSVKSPVAARASRRRAFDMFEAQPLGSRPAQTHTGPNEPLGRWSERGKREKWPRHVNPRPARTAEMTAMPMIQCAASGAAGNATPSRRSRRRVSVKRGELPDVISRGSLYGPHRPKSQPAARQPSRQGVAVRPEVPWIAECLGLVMPSKPETGVPLW